MLLFRWLRELPLAGTLMQESANGILGFRKSAASVEEGLDAGCNRHDVDEADTEDELNAARGRRSVQTTIDHATPAQDRPEHACRTESLEEILKQLDNIDDARIWCRPSTPLAFGGVVGAYLVRPTTKLVPALTFAIDRNVGNDANTPLSASEINGAHGRSIR